MRHTFQAEQWLPFSLPLVFNFFADPQNLPRLMPAWQKARIASASFVPPPPRPDGTPAGSVSAGAGTRMTLTFRPFPLSPLRASWDAEISEFLWNDHFCDIQHRGPFAFWRHCHRLQAQTRKDISGTLLTDHIEYELPLGFAGDLANNLFVRRQLASTFRYRQQRTMELLPASIAARSS